MWHDYILVSVWGGIVALDTTAALQIMISHPLVSCSIVGLLLGNFPAGFLVGIILELVWLDEMPVGAASFSEGNIGATVAAAIAILVTAQIGRMNIVIPLALMAGALVSAVGGQMVVFLRNINGRLYSLLLVKDNISSRKVTRQHFICIGLMFMAGMILTFLSVITFQFCLVHLCHLIPVQADKVLQPIIYAFFGIGCGVLLYIFLSRKNWWLVIIGLASGVAVFFL